ncbi:pacearchaeosortase [Candidatus Pacearchaeota archaeon]|nr:pacearchaeosortase [Candidatus Pacearchaeota archaeon]
MKKQVRKFLDIAVRYLILILIGIPNLWLFYLIFTPLTIYPVFFLLGLFFNATLTNNFIILENFLPIEIVGACVAGSAYYLLLILNLAIPMNINKRLKMLLFSFLSLLIINILRIFLLSLLFISGTSLFDITHELFWYVGSIVFVIGIWFTGIKIFKIKEIPFYSDLKNAGFSKHLKKTKKSKSSKKNK